MKQLFAILFVIAALFTFSSVVSAQDVSSAAKKVETVKRDKPRAIAKKKNLMVQKRIVTAPKPMLKKSVRKVTAPQGAKAKAAAKKRVGRSALRTFAFNPFVMMIWISLFITGLAIVDRILWKRRESEECSEVIKEKAEDDLPGWGQKLLASIKEFASRLKKKPALATC